MMQKYFSFSGRLNRKRYWLRTLVLFAVTFAAVMLLALAVGMGGSLLSGDTTGLAAGELGAGAILVGIVFFVVVLAVTVAGLSLSARRLHDRDKSAWWLVVFYVLPGILSGDSGLFGPPDGGLATVVNIVGLGLSLWGLVEIGFLRGTAGPNRFGEDPLEHHGAAADVFA